MEAINKAERTTSLINFIAVYVLILAVPLFLAFFAGTRKSSGGGSAKAVNEQVTLSTEMAALQKNVDDMRKHDSGRQAAMGSPENWQNWLNEAERQNTDFKKAVETFRGNPTYTEARNSMRLSACAYLDMVYYERGVHIENLKALRGERNETATIEQLKADKQQLEAQKSNLQNTINMQNAMLAKPAAGGGGGSAGGGQPNPQALTDLKWQLRFEDADCKKSQADLLAAHNEEATRRKQLYSSAKVNFQQIVQLAKTSFTIQRQATAKVREIDQTLSRL